MMMKIALWWCLLTGNGLIDFDEFRQMMEKSRHHSISAQGQGATFSSGDEEFRPLFAAFDKDNNGYIDAIELRTTMAAVGLELSDTDVEVMMKAAGVSKHDRIYYKGSHSFLDSFLDRVLKIF